MFKQGIGNITDGSELKLDLLKERRVKYVISSMLAGQFVGFGVVLAYTVGAYLGEINPALSRIGAGLSFGVALTLVLMAGGELFTSNSMIMAIGYLEKKNTAKDGLKILFYCYIGNILGSAVLALFMLRSGLLGGIVGEYMINVSMAKIEPSFMELMIRGILCNVLVSVAVWSAYKLKDETAKLIVVFWSLFAFVTSGFEHSVANMTLFPITLLIKDSGITFSGVLVNMTAVTLGNFIGGALLVGLPYWYVSKKRGQARVCKIRGDCK